MPLWSVIFWGSREGNGGVGSSTSQAAQEMFGGMGDVLHALYQLPVVLGSPVTSTLCCLEVVHRVGRFSLTR